MAFSSSAIQLNQNRRVLERDKNVASRAKRVASRPRP